MLSVMISYCLMISGLEATIHLDEVILGGILGEACSQSYHVSAFYLGTRMLRPFFCRDCRWRLLKLFLVILFH